MTFLSNRSKPVKILLLALLLAVLVPAAWYGYGYAAMRVEIAQWDPDDAAEQAASDIKAGAMRIYLHGSMSARWEGVREDERVLVAHLPQYEAGVGCVVRSFELFAAQGEYAKRYNRVMVDHFASKAAVR